MKGPNCKDMKHIHSVTLMSHLHEDTHSPALGGRASLPVQQLTGHVAAGTRGYQWS